MMIDIFFCIFLLLAVFKGIRRGLIVAVFSMISGIIGLAAAIKLSAVVASHLKDSVHLSAKWLPILAFILVFLGVVLIVRWVANLIQAAVNFAWLGWVNKLGGVILYSALYLAVLSICLFYGTASHIISNHAIQASIVYPFIAPWGPALINGLGKIIPFFKDMFVSLEGFFANLAGKIR